MEKENLTNQSNEDKELKEQQQKLQKYIHQSAQQMSNVKFWEFLNSPNFTEALDKLFQNYSGNRKTFIQTYLLDIILVVALLLVVTFLGFQEILDGVTVGTLVGAIIGYALGRFREQ